MSGTTKRLQWDEALLVVVDMQEKLVAAMDKPGMLVEHAEKLVKGFAALELPMLFTQQYTKGLGETVAPVKAATADENGSEWFSYIEKLSYSVMGEPAFVEKLRASGRKQIVICGIEAHVCVLQSALDFLDEGYDVFLVANAVASRSRVDSGMAFRRVEEAGAVVTTIEAVLFELLGTAAHPKFKSISALVK
ncbi:MAG: isochorismatase family protein [Clostridiales Family XIII bacterium]|jgi:nicotinamidase-related amidase|nr:isochorismatase family protein [Clostridiales Family XIII bacterium]